MFKLHPQLANDTVTIGDFPLCRLLLMNDSQFPWFILVPRRDGIQEIYQLTSKDQKQLLKESSHLSETMYRVFEADKMNIAALGNMVPQLHIHHIARYREDSAWPKPVWGHAPAKPYTNRALQETCNILIEQLENFAPDKDLLVSPRVC